MAQADTDGDGILDAEELMPKYCSVATLMGYNVPDGQNPPYPTYDDYWKKYYGSYGYYHDIDMEYGTDREIQTKPLDSNNKDTDGDGLTDGEEIMDSNGFWPDDPQQRYNNADYTNPLDPDSDDDGFNDRSEVSAGTNPNIASSHPS